MVNIKHIRFVRLSNLVSNNHYFTKLVDTLGNNHSSCIFCLSNLLFPSCLFFSQAMLILKGIFVPLQVHHVSYCFD